MSDTNDTAATVGLTQATPSQQQPKSSFEQKLANIGGDLKNFYAKLAADYQKGKKAWILISSPQTRAILVKLGSDAITTVKDSIAAGKADGFNFTLDAQVVSDIKQLIADGKAGEGVVVADLKVLGITL